MRTIQGVGSIVQQEFFLSSLASCLCSHAHCVPGSLSCLPHVSLVSSSRVPHGLSQFAISLAHFPFVYPQRFSRVSVFRLPRGSVSRVAPACGVSCILCPVLCIVWSVSSLHFFHAVALRPSRLVSTAPFPVTGPAAYTVSFVRHSTTACGCVCILFLCVRRGAAE